MTGYPQLSTIDTSKRNIQGNKMYNVEKTVVVELGDEYNETFTDVEVDVSFVVYEDGYVAFDRITSKYLDVDGEEIEVNTENFNRRFFVLTLCPKKREYVEVTLEEYFVLFCEKGYYYEV